MTEIRLLGKRHGVVLPVRADPSGTSGPRRRDAVGDAWRRTSRGRYVPADVEVTPDQRIAEVGVLLPRHGAITGWAALLWLGGHWFAATNADGSPRPVPVAVPGHPIRSQSGFLVCEERWSPREVTIVDGLRLTTPVRSACFEMRYAVNLDQAVVAMDMAAFHDLVSLEEAADWAALHQTYTGIEKARQAASQGDENAWSPMEVLMRRDLKRMGRPGLLSNRPLFDLAGRHLGTPDLVDPWAGVVFEYDGRVHFTRGLRAHDLAREHAFMTHGLQVVVMVAEDRADPRPWRERVHHAYAKSAGRPASDRAWTMTLPDWWRPTFTVRQRRVLSDRDRSLWLRHRAG